jgi:hypothetical protein
MLITLDYLPVILIHVHHVISFLMHTWYSSCAHACNRCTGGSDTCGVRMNQPGGGGASSKGPASRTRGQRGGCAWVSQSRAIFIRERQVPEHSKPHTLRKQWVYMCYLCIVALSYRSWLETLAALICPLLVQYTCLESYLSAGSNSCLAMLYTGRSRVISYHLRHIGSIESRLAIFAIVKKTMWLNEWGRAESCRLVLYL